MSSQPFDTISKVFFLEAVMQVAGFVLSVTSVVYLATCASGDSDFPKMLKKPRNTIAPYKSSVALGKHGLLVTGKLEFALRKAALDKKCVFAAFVGESNIKSSRDMLALSETGVKLALEPYTIAILYVDTVPAQFFTEAQSDEARRSEALANYEDEESVLDTKQVPFYAVLKPFDGEFESIATYGHDLSSDPNRFVRFLTDARKRCASGK